MKKWAILAILLIFPIFFFAEDWNPPTYIKYFNMGGVGEGISGTLTLGDKYGNACPADGTLYLEIICLDGYLEKGPSGSRITHDREVLYSNSYSVSRIDFFKKSKYSCEYVIEMIPWDSIRSLPSSREGAIRTLWAEVIFYTYDGLKFTKKEKISKY